MKKKLAAQFATMNQKDVSRACGLMWRSEPEHVKLRYRQSYNKEKRDFERLCTTTSALEPSEEALSALASVIASAQLQAASSPAAAAPEKKRRLSEGCRSAPMSPPQTAALAKLSASGAVRSKRPRSFHTPSRSELVAFPPTASSTAISLPSCASLLSMAGTLPGSLSSDPSSASTRHHSATLAPLHSRHPSGMFSLDVEHSSPVPLPVPRGAFDASAAAYQHKQQMAYSDARHQSHYQPQQYRRVYAAPPIAPLSFHRYSVSGAEFPSQAPAAMYAMPPPAQYPRFSPSAHYSVHQ
ncbi:hypothetical protein GGI04_005375 [Coemansia thaxteri]|nr:hypothetical protein GGI04_005375 [Coemansia thaxteri]KAJ2457553.1 hypothetical protein GGI02_006118 [Coemansia sp. RSA 2322]